MGNIRWKKEEIDFLKNNYGILSLQEISNAIGKTIPAIKHKVARENIQSPKTWTQEEIDYICKHYKEMTNKELAENIGRTKTAVDLKINRLGLEKSKYVYDRSFFHCIDNEDKAYWCGFIMADGCVTIQEEINSCELQISLQARDGSHLKKFNKAISGNVPVEYFEEICNLNNKPHKVARIRLYSQEIFHDLEKYNVIPNKSLVKQFPQNIPDELLPHYIRGYFDGNGSVYKCGSTKLPEEKRFIGCNFSCGSYEFISELKRQLENHGIKSGSVHLSKKDSKCYQIQIRGLSNTDRFLNYIYNNSTIYLERKFQKKEKIYTDLHIKQRLLRHTEMYGSK